jgi:DNA-binding MarR family transcriptional regulator
MLDGRILSDNSDAVDGIRERLGELFPKLDTKAYAVTARILRLAQTIEARRAVLLASHGITPGEFDVLATLRRSDDDVGVNPGSFLESLLITSGGLSKRLDRLEEDGLIERKPDPGDRRGTRVRLTRKGFEVIDVVIPMLVETEGQQTREVLTDRQVEQASSILRRLGLPRE